MTPRYWRGRIQVTIRAFALTALAACAGSGDVVGAYREQHPAWTLRLPTPGIGLEEVLVSLNAPSRFPTQQVAIARLDVLRFDVDPWESTSYAAIREGAAELEPDRDSVVLVSLRCTFYRGLEPTTVERWGMYLLPRGRLSSWDHPRFRDGCRSDSEFAPARGESIAVEREAGRALHARGGRVAIGLAEVYRRGVSLIEVGRLLDARAMFVTGERMRADVVRQEGDDAPPLERAEASRQRLIRALGVEVPDRR